MGSPVIEQVLGRRQIVVSSVPFIATSFLGAALIFLVQPMFARMATPLLGGTPAVWNVSLVCFQAALLAGYGYAHALQKLKSVRTQVIVHAVVLAAGLACLPLRISGIMGEPSVDSPTLWLLGTFAVSIAPPFAALAATAPLIQAWYARSGLSDAADPYHLYAASNIGSLIGLAAYPLMIEPFARLADQTTGWAAGFVLLAAVLLYSGWSITRVGASVATADQATKTTAPTWREMLMWLALSFVPSSLLVGATSHITTDVAAAPFLWAPPLMLYLLTFVIAFGKKPLVPHKVAVVLAPLGAALAMLTLSGLAIRSLPLAIFANLFALFIISLACHGALIARRPDASRLTKFYLIMSLGGVLGGAFNALLAPMIFDNVLEYPLMLVAGVALLSVGNMNMPRTVVILLVAGGVALATALVLRLTGVAASGLLQIILITPAVLAIVASRRAPMGAALGLALAAPTGWALDRVAPIFADRSFFGVIRVVDSPSGDYRMVVHGTTVHGVQALIGDVLQPRAYYAPTTPIAQTFRLYADAKSVAIAGLGVGVTACFSRPDQNWTFFEIDPLMADVAVNPKYFTFMSGCRPNADIVLGDARIKLADYQTGAFDLVMLDAFSSDSVPTHLMTHEAFQLYFDKLTPDGLLMVHISNHHLSLRNVVARVADASGASSVHRIYRPSAAEKADGANASEVVLVSRNSATLERALATGDWEKLASDGGRPWTDDYSNIIGAMLAKSAQR